MVGSEIDLLKAVADPLLILGRGSNTSLDVVTAAMYKDMVDLLPAVDKDKLDVPEIYIEDMEEEQIFEQICMAQKAECSKKLVDVEEENLFDLDEMVLMADDDSDDDDDDAAEDDEDDLSEKEEEGDESEDEHEPPAKMRKSGDDEEKEEEVDDDYLKRMNEFLDRQEEMEGGNDGKDGEEEIDYFGDEDDEDDDEEGGLSDGGSSLSFGDEEDRDDFDDDDDDDGDKIDVRKMKHGNYFNEDDDDNDDDEDEKEEVADDDEEEERVIEEDKPWQMRGEALANQRPLNTLLEEDAQFQQVSRPDQHITDDFTYKLEQVVKRRFLDKALDDVVRKLKPVRDPLAFKKRVVLDQEKSKLSLGEIYEREYLAQVNRETEEGKKDDPAHQEITKLMRSLFRKMDALADNHYKPSLPEPEIKVVSNLPAVSAEDVQPVMSSQAQLLAPEEVYEKEELVAAEEKTKEEKKRDLRKKKIRQKAKAQARQQKLASMAETSEKAKGLQAMQQLEKAAKLPSGNTTIIKDNKSNGEKKSKSSKAFFTQLQQQNEAEATAKKSKLGNKRKLAY